MCFNFQLSANSVRRANNLRVCRHVACTLVLLFLRLLSSNRILSYANSCFYIQSCYRRKMFLNIQLPSANNSFGTQAACRFSRMKHKIFNNSLNNGLSWKICTTLHFWELHSRLKATPIPSPLDTRVDDQMKLLTSQLVPKISSPALQRRVGSFGM